MKLEYDDYKFSKEIVDETLKINVEKIEFHIRDSLKSFIGDMDVSDYNVNRKIFLFLEHMSSLFLNYYLNGESVYNLTEVQIKKSRISRKIITNIIKDFR